MDQNEYKELQGHRAFMVDLFQYMLMVEKGEIYKTDRNVRAVFLNIKAIFNDYAGQLGITIFDLEDSIASFINTTNPPKREVPKDDKEPSESDKEANFRELKRVISIKERSETDSD